MSARRARHCACGEPLTLKGQTRCARCLDAGEPPPASVQPCPNVYISGTGTLSAVSWRMDDDEIIPTLTPDDAEAFARNLLEAALRARLDAARAAAAAAWLEDADLAGARIHELREGGFTYRHRGNIFAVLWTQIEAAQAPAAEGGSQS